LTTNSELENWRTVSGLFHKCRREKKKRKEKKRKEKKRKEKKKNEMVKVTKNNFLMYLQTE
jgi:hypothetical protein